MTIVRAAQSTTYLTSEALRARVIQAGATSQAAKPEVSSSSTSMEELTASASVIYRQRQNEVPADNTYGHLEVWTMPSWGHDPEKMRSYGEIFSGAMNAMDGTYQEFKQSLKKSSPDLANQDFGFSIDSKGDLVATGVSGEQKTKLTQLINKIPGFKELAKDFAVGLMGFAKAESNYGLGRFKLDLENFQQTIDIGQALDSKHKNNDATGNWFFQLERKGQYDHERLKPVRLSQHQ